MIQVFCNERGAGKTKELISLANTMLLKSKGDSVYIDEDLKHFRQIDRRIRFVSIADYNIIDCESFYGLLCGIISGNYDIENIYIDGFFDVVSYDCKEISNLFKRINDLSDKFSVNIFINISNELKEVPDYIREFVA